MGTIRVFTRINTYLEVVSEADKVKIHRPHTKTNMLHSHRLLVPLPFTQKDRNSNTCLYRYIAVRFVYTHTHSGIQTYTQL